MAKKNRNDKLPDLSLPAYLPVNINNIQKYITVCGFIVPETDGTYRKNKGYVNPDDNHVWIFNGSEPPLSNQLPYFWYDNHYICFGPMRDEVEKYFRVDKLVPWDITERAKLINPNEPLYDETALSDMNSAQSRFIPEVDEKNDDILKKIVKKTIIRKKVNTAKLKSRLGPSYSFSNLKTALTNTTKMSVPNFLTWMDLLGCKFKILLTDNGFDPSDKINGILVYDSATDEYTSYKTMDHFAMNCRDYQVFYPSNPELRKIIDENVS